MSFSDPRWLWVLSGLVPLLILEWRAARRGERALERLVGARKQHVLLGQRLPGQRRAGVILRSLACALLAIGAAGPEWGRELVKRSATGSDVVLLVDVSASMDVRDVAPSRLEEARREALAVLDHLQGSKIGVVAFAGDAIRLCPLTLDRSAARLVLESLSSGAVSTPGSDLGRGLRAAARLLPQRRRTEQAIVAWTDGEDLEEAARGAIDELARSGLRVFAVGVGTRAGDVVPVLDDQGRAVDVKRDENGGPVRSQLDEELLRTLARGTHGSYFSAARPGGELPRLLATLGSLARGQRGERLVERPVPQFPWFAGGAALLLAVEVIRRRRRDENGASGGATIARAASVVLIVLAFTPEARAQSAWARGDQALRQGRWAAAESLYVVRAGRGAPPEVLVNLAVARARLGKGAEAEAGLRRASGRAGRTGQVAGYNLGTQLAERGDDQDALQELRRAIERDPNDLDARFNYEWTLRRQQERRDRSAPPPRPRPEPSQSGPQGPPQTPSGAGQSQAAPQPQAAPPPPPRASEGMDRQQAEQLLGSLHELERLEQQRLRRVRVMRERRGRDW